MSDPRQQGSLRRWLPLAATWAAALVLATTSSAAALARYREFRSAYPWDLAYYNQWFWALTRGDGIISVRPVAWYALEGPSVWEMNYLAPIRFLLVPFYLLDPGPEILLILQNIVFW